MHTPHACPPCHSCPHCHAHPLTTHVPCHTCPPPSMPTAMCASTMYAPCDAHPPCHTCLPTTHTPCYAHSPVNRITDRCKNITFPQLLLWTVITVLIIVLKCVLVKRVASCTLLGVVTGIAGLVSLGGPVKEGTMVVILS